MRRPTLVITALAVLFAALPAQAGETLPRSGDAFLPGAAGPLGTWDGTPPAQAEAGMDALWSLRTGFRKGVLDQALPAEREAAPDVAVLRSGAFAAWAGLLAGFQEPSVLAGPDGLAGLNSTKPVLIIPSDGLAGLASSAFFRAGLAEYVRSGGVALCFTQRTGADLAALPVPDDESLGARGWTEENGPFFRASAPAAVHPALTALDAAVLSFETAGSVGSHPGNSVVLLRRSDGRPTLLLYPVAKGWVVLAMLASDHAFRRDALEEDERTLVRNLVHWAKTGGRMTERFAGQRYDAELLLRGPEQGEASSVRITVTGPDGRRPATPMAERSFPLSAKSGQTAAFPYSYWVPPNAPPGIHRLEYALLDRHDRRISPSAEISNGWFAVVPNASVPAVPARPLPPAPSPVTVVAEMGFPGKSTRLSIMLSRADTGTPLEVLVLAAGQEQRVALSGDRASAVFDLGPLAADRPVAYRVLQDRGRVLARGVILAPAAGSAGVSLERSSYPAGGVLRAAARNLGLGAMTLVGPGAEQDRHISKDTVFESPVAPGLPTGFYPLRWKFVTRTGGKQEGMLPVMVKGTDVRVSGATVLRERGRDAEARLTISASDAVTVQFGLQLAAPDGEPRPAGELTVPLTKGEQNIALSFPFKPDRAGIWQLRYALSAPLPDGPGMEQRMIDVAAGSIALDAGDAAVIGLRLGRPVYYDTSLPAEVTAYVHTDGKAKLDLLVDGDRIRRERIRAPGTVAVTAAARDLSRGSHRASVVVTDDGLQDRREHDFLYGARLPDLAVVLRAADPSGPVLETGVGVMNQGKARSDQTQASLYELAGDRERRLIRTVAIPPLEPGRQHVAIIPWPLAGKAGARPLVGIVDQERAVVETDEENNSAEIILSIPDALLFLHSPKDAYTADEEIRYRVGVVNYLSTTLSSPVLELQTADPAGMVLSRETVTLRSLEPGGEETLERPFAPASVSEGTYLVSARLLADRPLAADSLGITLLPTLLLRGSLDGTAAAAAPCAPFTVAYRVADAGNVPPMNGTLKIELRTREQDQVVFAQQAPFSLGQAGLTIPRIDLPRGAYTLVFQGSAVNPQRGMSGEFSFDRRPLEIAGPVALTRSREPLPRVLLWSGGDEATAIERALAEKITREAFGNDEIYLKTAASAEQFLAAAATGHFNVFVLLEASGSSDAEDALRQALERGGTVIVAGSGEPSRRTAEALGFRFTDPRQNNGSTATFPPDSGLRLTGTLPVSGTVLAPLRNGGRSLGSFEDGAPAVLKTPSGRGAAVVIPFSLIHSALRTGVSTLYSLLLRSVVDAAAPGRDDSGIVSMRLTYAAATGRVRARIAEQLPPGADMLWTSRTGKKESGTLTFDLTADQEPGSILYLYRAGQDAAPASGEVFYDCRGSYVSQGKIE